MDEKRFSTNQLIVAGFLFVLFYVVLFVLSASSSFFSELPVLGLILNLPNFASPMFYLLPVASFFFLFFLVDWVNKYFETRYALHPLFVVLFFLLSLAAYYVALYWYYANLAALGGASEVQFDYWGKLQTSAFIFFLWGGVFGWVSRLIIEKVKL